MQHQLCQKILCSLGVWLWTIPVFAAEGSVSTHSSQLMEQVLIGFMALTILVALIAMGWVMNTLLTAQKMRMLEEYGLAASEQAGIATTSESFWSRWYKKLTQTVPVEQEREILLDHNYDGIRELDNKLPPWWVATFYLTIGFGIFYMAYYHFSEYGVSQQQEYVLEMEYAQARVAAYLATQADQVDETNVEAVLEHDEIALGASLFQASCAVCHGAAGEGGTGPNLTDEYWLHGGDIKHIFATIKYGVPEKGMISWKSQLRPSDMQRISSFILTLQGTDPPNAKEPQGEPWVQVVEELAPDEEVESETENGNK